MLPVRKCIVLPLLYGFSLSTMANNLLFYLHRNWIQFKNISEFFFLLLNFVVWFNLLVFFFFLVVSYFQEYDVSNIQLVIFFFICLPCSKFEGSLMFCRSSWIAAFIRGKWGAWLLRAWKAYCAGLVRDCVWCIRISLSKTWVAQPHAPGLFQFVN